MSREATAEARGSRARSVLKRVAAVIAVVALLAWVLRGAWQDARQIDWAALQLRPGLIALACLTLGLAFVWHGLVWVGMMRGLGYPLPWLPGLRASALSQFGNYVPGKVFILIFRVQVAARYGVPAVPVVGSIGLETLLRNLMATIIAAIGVVHLGEGRDYLAALVTLIVVSVIFAQPRIFHAIGDFVLRKLGRPPLPGRLTGPQVFALLGCYLAYWALYTAGFYLLLKGTFGAEPTLIPWLATALGVSQIGSTLFFFAPVGIGAVELTTGVVLQWSGAVAAPYMVAVLARVWRTVAELAEIGVVMLITAGNDSEGQRTTGNGEES